MDFLFETIAELNQRIEKLNRENEYLKEQVSGMAKEIEDYQSGKTQIFDF